MLTEAGAKHNAIAQAMGAMGVTVSNADAFMKQLNAGTLPKETIYRLNTLANKYMADYRTSSDMLAMSRNRFSKYFFWNVRASYLINRAGEFLYGFEKAAKAIQDGTLDPLSMKSLMKHFDENEELRTVVFTTILSAKVATYVDRYYDDRITDKDKADQITGFWEGLNDYYAALMSNLPVRMLLGPINDTRQYVSYMDSYGKETTV